MTPREYFIRWAIAGALFLLAARWFLVEPIIRAIRESK